MVVLTFHGGVDEIGGNKVLLETDDGAVLLDFGRRMGMTGEYYSEFLQVRSRNALRDLLRLGVLPEIDGVYDASFLDVSTILEDKSDMGKIPVEYAPDYWLSGRVKPFDPDSPRVGAVFVSHAHFDHIQDVSFLDPSIPIICTDETEILVKAISDVSVSAVDQQFYELKRQSHIIPKKPGHRTLFPGALDYKDLSDKQILPDEKTDYQLTKEYVPQYRTFITELEGEINGIKYRQIPVGHSVPGACSVLLTLPDGRRILYTGDIRFKGITGASIDKYVEAVGEPVDYLITEGTRINSESVITEEDIMEEIKADIGKSEGLVLVDFGWKDSSRVQVIYEAAKANNRVFVIGPKTAYLLYEMHINFPHEYDDPREMPNLKVYLKREKSLLYSNADYSKFKMGYLHHHGKNSALDDWNIVRIAERLGIGGKDGNVKNPLPNPMPPEYREVYELATHHLRKGVRAYEIRANPKKYVLVFSYWDSNELFDLIPGDGGHQTWYIKASTEPFNDETMIDEGKFMNWLDKFGVDYEHDLVDKENKVEKIFTRRHISGHASQPELVEMITKLDPGKIIPVHTLDAKKYEEFFPGKVILLEGNGEKVEL